MNTYDHIQSRVYANDPDYDAFRGRLIAEYTVERVDKRRNCTIRTTYEVIDIGRPDPVSPVDPDAQMGPESLGYDRLAAVRAAHARARVVAEERKQRVHDALVAYLQEHGPQPIKTLLDVTEYQGKTAMRAHLASCPETFVRLREIPGIWGLVGIHDRRTNE